MTRRWPCIVVASLCGLFPLSTSAHAEGAWVIWVRNGLWDADTLLKREENNHLELTSSHVVQKQPNGRAVGMLAPLAVPCYMSLQIDGR